jgi:tRNA pseudouridine55 synthase
VQIHDLTVRETDKMNEYMLDVHCSAGTYIRTLCADMGRDLGCGGVMATLRRTKTGRFAIADCVTPEALAAMSMEERLSLLRPVEALFEDLPAVTLPPFYERLARCGCEIYQKKIGNTAEAGTRFRLLGENGTFFALGEVQAFEEGNAIKPIKQFEV